MNTIITAEKILSAWNIQPDNDGFYFFAFEGKQPAFHELTPANAQRLIDEAVQMHSIDYFDDSCTSGTVEINGASIFIENITRG